MSDIKNLVLGVTVAAVVLIVVAVPILGGLAGSNSTLYGDDLEPTPYYYRTITEEYYPVSMTINNTYRSVTWATPEGNIDATFEKEIDNRVPLLFDTTATNNQQYMIYTSVYSTNDWLLMNNNTVLNANYYFNSFASKTMSITISDGTMTLSGTKTSAGTYPITLDDGIRMICPRDIAELTAGTKMLTESKVITAIIMTNVTLNTNSTIGIVSDLDLDLYGEGTVNVDSTDTQFTAIYARSTPNMEVQYSGSIDINKGGNGYWIIEVNEFNGSNRYGSVESVDGYLAIVPLSFSINTESEYSHLIWLLPVMLAVVLVASVAYQIVPKRRNTE